MSQKKFVLFVRLFFICIIIISLCLDLLNNRDGCVICMDYSDYNKDYPFLIAHFKPVSKVLTDKLVELRNKGFRNSDAYFFGFSYGARLITRAGNDIGQKQLGIIHCKCLTLD